ncbi:MAG: hypothetical protein JWN40_333 [Phycisphaerales bacterium]|nr:hypothetical protein [Phycisphaerales bacterium]
MAMVALMLLAWLASVSGGKPNAESAAANPASGNALALLETHCVKCHGGEKTKGGLSLLTREALLHGGESGAAVVPGKPDASLLLKSVRHETESPMPHKEAKLPDAAIAQLARWVQDGAPYARPLNKAPVDAASKPATFTLTDADRHHWAFQPVARPKPPQVEDGSGNPIDLFIRERLRTSGVSPSPPASRAVLIRRVTFDLIGLPPTPAEIDAFVNDASPKAYEALIDRLLASPQYGERWGRHWLDLARFAETDGFEHDAVRPHAWRYRDYVIRSFNADKPYDRFVREQLAGDELWPDDPDAQVATGFNLLGPDMVDSADQQQRRHNTLNDMTDTAALAFMGLTVGCARCHDHKFEPLSQRDYYRLQAYFSPAAFLREREIRDASTAPAFEAATKQFNEHPAVRELAELEAPAIEKIRHQKLAKLSPEAQAAHQTPPDRRTTEQANLVLETDEMVQVLDREIAGALGTDAKARRKQLVDTVKQLPKPPAQPLAMALGRAKGAPAKTFVLFRGEYTQPGDEVDAGVPAVLASSSTPSEESAPIAAHPRIALANWVANPQNPLTARVMVNRIWQHHFGRGLVTTPSDFGTHGQKPTHPELLDWLAGEFIDGAWSIKRMHKLMLMSATYQQQSSTAAMGQADRVDPENRLYWRMNRIRLEGEIIRDSVLAISGQLNLQMGGPGVFPPLPEDVFKGSRGWTVSRDPRDQVRRSVYIFVRRNLRFPFLEVFDAPDNNLSCPARERSTTALQALTLLNADEVMTASKATAQRLTTQAASQEEQVRLAYRLTLGRAPTAREHALTQTFLARSPLSEFCRVLFNLNDFVYVE